MKWRVARQLHRERALCARGGAALPCPTPAAGWSRGRRLVTWVPAGPLGAGWSPGRWLVTWAPAGPVGAGWCSRQAAGALVPDADDVA